MRCSKCEAECLDSTSYCGYCGSKLPLHRMPETVNPGRESLRTALVIIVVLTVIAAVEGVLLLDITWTNENSPSTNGDPEMTNEAQVEIVSWTHFLDPYVNHRVEAFNFVLENTGETAGNVTVECNLETEMYSYLVRYGVFTVYPSETLTCSVYLMFPDSDTTAIRSVSVRLIPYETE